MEAQARAVEYGQMFQYDQLRPQLLEHMPPLDAAAYARSAAAAGKLDAAQAELVSFQPCLRKSTYSGQTSSRFSGRTAGQTSHISFLLRLTCSAILAAKA